MEAGLSTLHSGMGKTQGDERENKPRNRGKINVTVIKVFFNAIFLPSASLDYENIAITERIG